MTFHMLVKGVGVEFQIIVLFNTLPHYTHREWRFRNTGGFIVIYCAATWKTSVLCFISFVKSMFFLFQGLKCMFCFVLGFQLLLFKFPSAVVTEI